MEKSGNLKILNIDGTNYKTTYSEKFLERKKYVSPDKSKITAYIPGTIFKIFVKEGQKVIKGTRLVTLEAMKMRNRIVSPFNGIVKLVNVKEGQLVTKNAVLVEIEKISLDKKNKK
ncbi:acetyl-CoA carboxylase biotin carboxyl carrier protein subunit [Bacteroidota bacterium]